MSAPAPPAAPEKEDPAAPDAQPQPPPAPDQASAEPSGQANDDHLDNDDFAKQQRDSASVINHIYGNVNSAQMLYGVAGDERRTRSFRALDAAEIKALLRRYVEPAQFGDARRMLIDKRVVVLAGVDGMGRRHGSLALLAAVMDDDGCVETLAPSSSARLLAQHAFERGNGYLVQDLIVDHDASAEHRFDLDLLLTALRKAGAHLVLTVETAAAARGSLRRLQIDWAPPDLMTVLDVLLPELPAAPTAAEVGQLREHVGTLTRPRDVVELLARVVDVGVQAALADREDVVRTGVRDWFDRSPRLDDVLTVAALAFVHGRPQLTFESHRARLAEIADDLTGKERGVLEDGRTIPQTRNSWRADDTLIGVLWPAPREPRHFVFKEVGQREAVLAELVDRFGQELWAPLTQWADDVAKGADALTRLQLAAGVALLARSAFHDAVVAFVEPWAAGLVAQRFTAAQTLDWMCLDGELAPEALAIAVRWAKTKNVRRATTAAVALSGELGRQFWVDAWRLLWRLVLRGGQVGSTAGRALALRYAASAVDGSGVTTTLPDIVRGLRAALRGAQPEARIQRALGAALEIVQATHPETDEPMAAHVLRTAPQLASQLGEIVGEVLRSGARQALAVQALIATLTSLEADPAGTDAVENFAAGVRSRLSEREWQLLRPQVQHTLGGKLTGDVVTAMLDALDSRSGRKGWN